MRPADDSTSDAVVSIIMTANDRKDHFQERMTNEAKQEWKAMTGAWSFCRLLAIVKLVSCYYSSSPNELWSSSLQKMLPSRVLVPNHINSKTKTSSFFDHSSTSWLQTNFVYRKTKSRESLKWTPKWSNHFSTSQQDTTQGKKDIMINFNNKMFVAY